jgi:hypothetical protein
LPLLDVKDDTDRAVKADDTRNQVWAFMLRAEKCLPVNMALFQQMSFFFPARILSKQNPPDLIRCLKFMHFLPWRAIAPVGTGEVPVTYRYYYYLLRKGRLTVEIRFRRMVISSPISFLNSRTSRNTRAAATWGSREESSALILL